MKNPLFALCLLLSLSLGLRAQQAIVGGDGVRLRSSGDLDGRVVGALNTGDVVKVVDYGKLMDFEGDETVWGSGYRWYKVRDDKGLEGWLYGKYLYHFIEDGDPTRFYHEGQPWTLHLAQSQWLMAEGEPDGPDFEEETVAVVIRNEKSGAYHLVDDKGEFLIWFQNSGEGSSLTTVANAWEREPAKGQLMIQITTGYQEGMAEKFYFIRLDGGKFRVVDFWSTGQFGG